MLKKEITNSLQILVYNFSAHGQLTIRLLLDVNETCLRSQGFFDLWKQQKKYENDAALASLNSRLAEIDALPNDRQKWTEICRGVLAGKQDILHFILGDKKFIIFFVTLFFIGNMFDWGAQAVTDILDCGLYDALQKIQTRPWLYDGLDKWLEKLEVNL